MYNLSLNHQAPCARLVPRDTVPYAVLKGVEAGICPQQVAVYFRYDKSPKEHPTRITIVRPGFDKTPRERTLRLWGIGVHIVLRAVELRSSGPRVQPGYEQH